MSYSTLHCGQYIARDLVAEQVVINGSNSSVSLVPGKHLEGQLNQSKRAASRREARVLFAALLFALEFMLVARLLPAWVMGGDFTVWQRVVLFVLVYGLISWVTYLLVGSWARNNWALMKKHRGEGIAIQAELDRRHVSVDYPVKALRSWKDVSSRARNFFLG